MAVDPGGREREGSGFVVGFDRGLTFIATAAHVVEGDSRPRVAFAASPHLTYEAAVVRQETALDVAVLKVTGLVPGVVALPLDERPVEPADPLQAIGFPRRAQQPRWSSAAASAFEGGQIVLDKGLDQGHSGGPLLRDGWVVGLVKETDASYAFALPAAFVHQVVASWRVPVTAQRTATADGRLADGGPVTVGDFGDDAPVDSPHPPVGGFGSGASSPSGACIGEVVSRTGASQPVRLTASPSAMAPQNLPSGTQVQVLARTASSGHVWYQVEFRSQGEARGRGWMQDDHIRLRSRSCRW